MLDNKEWIPLHSHTMFSWDAVSKFEDIERAYKEYKFKAAAITDHGCLAGTVRQFKLCKKLGIKPILGEEFYVSEQDSTIKTKENRRLPHLIVLAKNLQGWKNLLKASSTSYTEDHYYYRPRLNIERLAEFGGGEFIVFGSHPGGVIYDQLWTDAKASYRARTAEDAGKLLRADWNEHISKIMTKYADLFGRENFYVEIQLIDRENLPAAVVAADCLRTVAKRLGFPCVATADSHYVRREDAVLQRILMCTRFRTNFNQIQKQLESEEDLDLAGFFRSSQYYIPSIAEMAANHVGFEHELENSIKIAEQCADYNILGNPKIPTFGENPEEQLRQYCREGWAAKIAGKIPVDKVTEYTQRIKYELEVLNGAGLAPYFLVVRDYITAARNRGEMVVMRGSATGCMVSYLIGITDIDPIPPGLLFERFYNAGRNSPGNVSLPDIDGDFETDKRHLTVQYLKDKYGTDKVAHVATFGRMQGRNALKETLRAFTACSFEEMNRICEYIPDESKIADDLQEMRDEGEDPSIIQWALENKAKELAEWVTLKDDGSLDGPLWKYFELAKKLEGVKLNMGQHAAAVVISDEPLAEICPMVRSAGGSELIAGMEFTDLESIGVVKYDILGVNCLDKLSLARRFLAIGELE